MPFPDSAFFVDIGLADLPFLYTITNAVFAPGTLGDEPGTIVFRFITDRDIIVGCSTNSFGAIDTFTAELYMDDGTVLTSSIVDDRQPWVRYLSPGTYWIWCYRNGDGIDTIPSDIVFRFEEGPIATLPLPVGARIINDDGLIPGVTTPHAGEPFPATAYSAGGAFLGFIIGMPAGETGAALPSGITLWSNATPIPGTNAYTLYDPSQNVIAQFDVPSPIIDANPRITADDMHFYIVDPLTGEVFRVTNTGTVTSIATLAGPAIGAIGVTRDGSTMYWTTFDASGVSIHAHDLLTDTALPDFYTVPELDGSNGFLAMTAVNYNPGEILVMSDGSIAFWYEITGVKNVLVHLDSSGAVLSTRTYLLSSGLQINHAYLGQGNSDSIEVWFYRSGGADYTVGTLALATGVLSNTKTGRTYDRGILEPGGTDDDELFGPSNSCTMITAKFGTETTPPGTDVSTPDCCDEGIPDGVDPEDIPPTEPLPPFVRDCIGGGVVPSAAPVADGEIWG